MGPNTTRDHLANERTFLAYVRTALAFIAFGFVVARFSLFLRAAEAMQGRQPTHVHESVTFGILMVFIGIAVGAFGLVRYKRQHDAILSDDQAPLNVRIAAILCALLIVAGFVIAYELYRIS